MLKGLHDIWFGWESIKINNYFIRASRKLKAVYTYDCFSFSRLQQTITKITNKNQG